MQAKIKTGVLVLLCALSAQASEKRAGSLAMEDWAAVRTTALMQACERGKHADYDRAYSTIVTELARQSSKFTDKYLDRFERPALNDESAYLETIRNITPYLLPHEYEGRQVFVECGLKLRTLHDDRTQSSLDEYESCLNLNYREEWPKLARQLFDCESKFIKR